MDDLRKLHSLLETPKRVTIVTHFRPDADALGSSLALAAFLEKTGHRVTVVAPSEFPGFLAWMKGAAGVHVVNRHEPATVQSAERMMADAEVIFCLDFNSPKRIEALENSIRNASAVKVMIDHHLEPEDFAQFRLWNVTSASTAGLIFRYIQEQGAIHLIDADIADCLYAGLMTDTGGFRHNNTNAEEFRIAAALTDLGARPHQVASLVYDSNTLSRLQLTGHVLCNKLTVLPEYHTAYMVLSRSELDRFKAQAGDTEGLVNYGLSIEGVKLALLMHDREGEVKLSLRSVGEFSVNAMARKHFNGGGHRNAAGGSSKESLEDTLKRFISILPEYKAELDKL